MMSFFDEKSDKWLKFFKITTIALFFLFLAVGVLGGLGDATAEFMDAGLGGDDDGLLDFLVWVILFGGAGFIILVANMLIIQLLNNVQMIRVALYQEEAPATPAAPAPVCANCGAPLEANATFCGKCGAPVVRY